MAQAAPAKGPRFVVAEAFSMFQVVDQAYGLDAFQAIGSVGNGRMAHIPAVLFILSGVLRSRKHSLTKTPQLPGLGVGRPGVLKD